MSRPHILLIHTGGTFGMAPGPDATLHTGPSLSHLLRQVPELNALATFKLVVPWNQDSAANEPEDVLKLAQLIRDAVTDCQGVVLIHGTDTMAFTASMLGFLLADLPVPVVITGSQRPLAYVRSDARSNLVDAVILATRGIAEVGICFGDHWYRGVATDKLSVHQYEAFGSPNLPPLAEMGLHVRFHPHAGHFKRQVPPGLGHHFEKRLAIYTPFPGMAWHLPPPDTRGVLIQAYGAGNLPMGRQDLQALFAFCRKRDIPLVVTSQCLRGGVELNAYELGHQAEAAGGISGLAHTRWAALAKLGLLLGIEADLDTIRESFALAWAGEPL